MRKGKRPRKQLGHTLLENLMAIFVVAMSAALASSSFPIATSSHTKGSLHSVATNAAAKEMEQVRQQGYPNLTPDRLLAAGLIDSTTPVAADTYSFTNADSANDDNLANILPSGNGTVKLETLQLDLRRVTITINYRYRNQTKTIRVATLIANI